MKRIWIPVVVAGVMFIGVSALVGDANSVWWQTLLLNLGTTVLLILPIYLITRSLERRVEQQVGSANTRIDDLSSTVADVETQVRSIQELADEFAQQRETVTGERRDLFRSLAQHPTREQLHKAVDLAESLRLVDLVDTPGLRAPIQESATTYLALIRYFEGDDLNFQLQDIRGHALPDTNEQELLWPADDQNGLAVFFPRVEDLLYRAQDFHQLDPAHWFRRISATLLAAFKVPDARPIVELIGDQWAMLDDIALALPHGYPVPYNRMPVNSKDPLSQVHVARKAWAHEPSVDRAYWVGQELLNFEDRRLRMVAWPETVQRRYRRR